MDRSTVAHGQNITFTINTTPQTQFVFAIVNNVRVPATRVAANANNWTLTVTPTSSTNITIFANTIDSENGAASLVIPVTVTGVPATTTPTPPTGPVIPPAPANLGPIQIASITETPAQAAGQVQITIVTGRDSNEVWVNYNRVNNQRGTGRFARAEMLSQDANSRTWVINFRPTWTAQVIEVGSNLTYNWPGADTREHTLTLTQPFVAPIVPAIQNVTVSPRSVAHNANTTITVRTNADVNNVWVRDVDGREHNATRTMDSANVRAWTVTFNPVRTGNVTVFANSSRTETGAVQRTENITVAGGRATVINANASWVGNQWHDANITVTTNRYAQTVWAVMPVTGQRVQLSRTDSGTGNRTWSTNATNVTHTGQIVIHVSSQQGNIHALSADYTRNVSWTGVGGTGTASGAIQNVTHNTISDQSAIRGGWVSFRVTTSLNVTGLEITGHHRGPQTPHIFLEQTTDNTRIWFVSVTIGDNAPLHGHVSFDIRALQSGAQVGTAITPMVSIVPW
jgi:hypothetical protein